MGDKYTSIMYIKAKQCLGRDVHKKCDFKCKYFHCVGDPASSHIYNDVLFVLKLCLSFKYNDTKFNTEENDSMTEAYQILKTTLERERRVKDLKEANARQNEKEIVDLVNK